MSYSRPPNLPYSCTQVFPNHHFSRHFAPSHQASIPFLGSQPSQPLPLCSGCSLWTRPTAPILVSWAPALIHPLGLLSLHLSGLQALEPCLPSLGFRSLTLALPPGPMSHPLRLHCSLHPALASHSVTCLPDTLGPPNLLCSPKPSPPVKIHTKQIITLALIKLQAN